jgi:amidase
MLRSFLSANVLYATEEMVSRMSFKILTRYLVALLPFNLLIAAQICPNASTAIDGKPFPPLIDATTEDLITGLESGLFTSVDLVNAYVARIMEVNSTLKMVTELNPDALSIAATLDAQRKNGTIHGPLHGIPILIKNNIATMDKMNNTAGSYALLGAKVPRDSTMAKKLREAGAVILGKTNLSQWANYRSDNTSNGWSAYGGQTEGACRFIVSSSSGRVLTRVDRLSKARSLRVIQW